MPPGGCRRYVRQTEREQDRCAILTCCAAIITGRRMLNLLYRFTVPFLCEIWVEGLGFHTFSCLGGVCLGRQCWAGRPPPDAESAGTAAAL